MPEYVAGLCHMQDGELVPFDTLNFFAENHDEAVRQAVKWLSSTDLSAAHQERLRMVRRFDGAIEPMTLDNMREKGVRSLDIQCH
jgi:hypothetical protein